MPEHSSTAPIRACIRAAHEGDLKAVHELELSAFIQDRLSRRQLRYLLLRANACTLIAEEHNRVAGYVCLLFSGAHAHARIYSIAVADFARGRGLGSALLAAAEEAVAARGCVDVRLEVHCKNANAISLYRRCGYRQFAAINDYYSDHGQALRFAKALPRASKPIDSHSK